MNYSVVFAPEAQAQLVAIYRYIATNATSPIAERYTDAIVAYCEGLTTFPERSILRDDIRPGLRITNFKGRTVIAYAIHDQTIEILGILYGGQDFAAILS